MKTQPLGYPRLWSAEGACHWLVAHSVEAVCRSKEQDFAGAAEIMYGDRGPTLPVNLHLQIPASK